MIRLFHFHDQPDYYYARAGRCGTWYPDPGPGLCPECRTSQQKRVPPLILVPNPGNPQSLNRYAYSANNPLRYSDPSGHDWVDAVNFLLGFASQWASANTWMAPQAQEALSVQPNEPAPMTVGRHLGNVAAVVQGVTEVTVGASVDVGGVGLCLTGIGCLAGAPALVVGAAVAAHGVTVAVAGAAMEGQMLSDLMLQAKGHPVGREGSSSTQFKKLTGHEIKLLEKNGYDVHELKGGKGASRYDLYKDKDGNIYQKPKNGAGPGEEWGVNINDLYE